MSAKNPSPRFRLGDELPMVMTAEEVAALLGVTRQTVYLMVDAGELEANADRKRGRPLRIWAESVVAYVRGKRRSA